MYVFFVTIYQLNKMVRLHVYIVFPKEGSAELPMFDNICYPVCINIY